MNNNSVNVICIIVIASAVAWAGCGRNSENESVGEKTGAVIDNAVESTSEAAQATAEKTKEVTGEAIEKTGEVLEKAGAAVEKTGEGMQN